MMNTTSTSAFNTPLPNIQLVVNNALLKAETLPFIRITAPASLQQTQKNAASLPAVLLVVLLHLLIGLMLLQKNQSQQPASTAVPMMVTFVHDNKAETPIEPPPAEVKPVTQAKQKIVANTAEKAKLLATEETTELNQKPVLIAQQTVEASEQVTPPIAATNEAPAKVEPKPKSEPIYVAPSFGANYLHNPAPDYPLMARRKGEQGRVLIRVLVTLNGDAGNVTLEKSSGSTYLDEAALNAVKNWKFVPARSNNEAVSGYVTVPINFSLES
jgi:protein TonB